MAKRISLREFQRGLSERLLSAKRGEITQAVLGIESGTEDVPGGSRWLLDLSDSGEVVPLPALTAAPLTKPWFAGIANIRGTLYAVVDFSVWRGGQATPQNTQTRLLLVGARHGINAALLVKRSLGLKPKKEMQKLQEETGDDKKPWLGDRFVDGQGSAWTQLQVPSLLSDPEYLDIVL